MATDITAGTAGLHAGSNDRRRAMLTFCFVVGLGGPALCWVLALLGFQSEELRLDYIATIAVTLSVYAPVLAFYNNPGEARSLDRQLVHFAWLWFFSNTGYQVFWEMPWFLMKDTLMSGTITMQDTLFWPWWAYGVADTRYLQVNDLILGIEAMDGAFALFEVACIYFFLKGYRVFVAWVALILGSCMGWGQYYFYIGEIYTYFEKIQDGWFGFYIKFWLMGFPWLLYPVIAAFGFIWYLSAIYKRQAIEEYTSGRKPEFGKSFLRETDMLLTVSEYGERVEETANQSMIRKLILVAFAWPFVFLAIDIYRFYN